MPNRTTVKSNIVTKNVPTVTNAIMTDMLNAELADNVSFREDVAVAQASSATNITVDFTGKDRIDLTRTGGGLNITLSGIGDGETKFLLVTKTSGQVVSFVGVTDITPIKANANALSIVLYEIIRKSSYYFAKAWVENVKSATDSIEGVLETATQAESNALSAINKIVTPGRQPLARQGQQGIVELANEAQANTLTDLFRAISPGTIPRSTESQKGIIEVASAAENDAGTPGSLAVVSSELKRKLNGFGADIGIKVKSGGSVNGSNGVVTVERGDLTPTGIRQSAGTYTITHNFGDANYMLVINTNLTSQTVWGTVKSANYFQITISGLSAFEDADFDFDLFEYPTV